MKFKLYLFILLFLSACKSPVELLEEGKHKSAFKKAVREIKNNKNVAENTKVIEVAAEYKVNEAMQYCNIKSNSEYVEDWIKTQTKVYKLLEDLGEANLLTQGSITSSYDVLCNEKKEIDYFIVDHYYEEGQNHLDRFYRNGEKSEARDAYYSFKNCEKYEGDRYFLNLSEEIIDAHQNGIVYYVSNYGNIADKLFLKQLPQHADFLPDCDINIEQSYRSIDESKTSESKVYNEEIEVGREEIVDTSGNVIYKALYEEVEATVTTTTITITASITTYINSKNVTGQCNIPSSQFTTRESDSYEEISISGDVRALNTEIEEKSGAPSDFALDLVSKVRKRADRRIDI